MRIASLLGVVILLLALTQIIGCEMEVPTFASGTVSVYQAKTSRFAILELNSKQLVDLRQWLHDRRSGWRIGGKMPPETVVALVDAQGKQFQLRISSKAVNANLMVKSFTENEISALRNILGASLDG